MARYGEVRPVNVFANFQAGRQAAQDEQTQRQQNSLRDAQLQRTQNLNALAQNPQATPEQYIRAGDAATGNALSTYQQNQQVDKQQALTQLAGLAQKALSIQDPAQRKAFLASPEIAQVYGPSFQAIGADHGKGVAELQQLPDAELEQRLQQVAQFAQRSAPINVAAGGTLYDPSSNKALYTAPNPGQEETARHNRAMEAAASQKPQTNFKLMSPDEIKAAGLPDGTVAQRDATGKVDIINKREGLSAAEQKTIREAKMRMPRLNAAMRRVDRIGTALDAISKNTAFDGGPLDQYALSRTKQGQELNAAVAQLLPELQALTRVPGIGSQSDLESRQAALALPGLNVGPDVNAKSYAELKTFVSDLRSAYESLLTSGAPEDKQPTTGAPAVGTVDSGYRFKGGNPADPKNWEPVK